jgi:hypothetical protein
VGTRHFPPFLSPPIDFSTYAGDILVAGLSDFEALAESMSSVDGDSEDGGNCDFSWVDEHPQLGRNDEHL